MPVDPQSIQPASALWHRVAFGAIEGVGPARLARLRARFGDLGTAWRADENALCSAVGPKRANRIATQRPSVDVARLAADLMACGAVLVLAGDREYPALLAEIAWPPDLLFLRGDVTALAEPAVAVVGTRRATDYGKQATWRIVEGLVDAGLAIASGLASGIDAAAHEAALDVGGRTIAVLGCGIAACYPSTNAALMDRIIAEGGAVLSEYPPGMPPIRGNFPARNRIVSGLSLATVVVEAGARSGARITAGLAADQGREVFAVPGRIDRPTSIGSNRLLAEGAGVARHARDIVEALALERRLASAAVRAGWPADAIEQAVLEALGGSKEQDGGGEVAPSREVGADAGAERPQQSRLPGDDTDTHAISDSESDSESKSMGGPTETGGPDGAPSSAVVADADSVDGAGTVDGVGFVDNTGPVDDVGPVDIGGLVEADGGLIDNTGPIDDVSPVDIGGAGSVDPADRTDHVDPSDRARITSGVDRTVHADQATRALHAEASEDAVDRVHAAIASRHGVRPVHATSSTNGDALQPENPASSAPMLSPADTQPGTQPEADPRSLTTDELGRVTGLPAADVTRALGMLELKGVVERKGGVRWRLVASKRG